MQQITKRQARARFNKGLPTIWVPSKLRPEFPHAMVINGVKSGHNFEDTHTNFWVYNCGPIAGRFIKYYINE